MRAPQVASEFKPHRGPNSTDIPIQSMLNHMTKGHGNAHRVTLQPEPVNAASTHLIGSAPATRLPPHSRVNRLQTTTARKQRPPHAPRAHIRGECCTYVSSKRTCGGPEPAHAHAQPARPLSHAVVPTMAVKSSRVHKSSRVTSQVESQVKSSHKSSRDTSQVESQVKSGHKSSQRVDLLAVRAADTRQSKAKHSVKKPHSDGMPTAKLATCSM